MADIIVFEVHAGNVARALNFMWNLGLLQNMLLVNSTYCFSGRTKIFFDRVQPEQHFRGIHIRNRLPDLRGIVISTHLERSVSPMPNNTAVREKLKTYLEEFKKNATAG